MYYQYLVYIKSRSCECCLKECIQTQRPYKYMVSTFLPQQHFSFLKQHAILKENSPDISQETSGQIILWALHSSSVVETRIFFQNWPFPRGEGEIDAAIIGRPISRMSWFASLLLPTDFWGAPIFLSKYGMLRNIFILLKFFTFPPIYCNIQYWINQYMGVGGIDRAN
jgi:hypothetical protein